MVVTHGQISLQKMMRLLKPDFTNISRIISDPNDSNIVLISTNGSNGTRKI